MKKGQPMPLEARLKLSELNKTEKPGYQAIHIWVRKWGGVANYCEMEDETCSGKFEWSNISHEYKRDLNDFQQLCSSHHSRFDKAFRNKERKWNQAHLKVARSYAELSYAERLKVGAVLIKDNRVVAIGINGMPSGMDNTCEIDGTTKPEVVHAETNVIAFAAKNGVPTDGCSMIVTHSPCFECSKLLMQAGVKKIYYETEYRLTDSLDFLRKGGIEVEKL